MKNSFMPMVLWSILYDANPAPAVPNMTAIAAVETDAATVAPPIAVNATTIITILVSSEVDTIMVSLKPSNPNHMSSILSKSIQLT